MTHAFPILGLTEADAGAGGSILMFAPRKWSSFLLFLFNISITLLTSGNL